MQRRPAWLPALIAIAGAAVIGVGLTALSQLPMSGTRAIQPPPGATTSRSTTPAGAVSSLVTVSRTTARTGAPAPAPGPPAQPQPTQAPDRRPPSAVTTLRLESNTDVTFTIAWDAATDASGIRNYVVRRNGDRVATPLDTRVTLPLTTSVDPVLVQVAAVNNAGNLGEWRSIVVVSPTRPTPTVTATTTATPTPMPSPSATPTPMPSPSASSSASQEGTPTPTPTPSASPGNPTATLSSGPPTPSGSPEPTPTLTVSVGPTPTPTP